jgi:hypothetical protein
MSTAKPPHRAAQAADDTELDMNSNTTTLRVASAIAALAIGAGVSSLVVSGSASSSGQDQQAQAAATDGAVALYPALSAESGSPALSTDDAARIANAAPFARTAGAPPAGRVVIDDPAIRARVVTNGNTVCLWITYEDQSGSLGCRPADGEPFGALDSVGDAQLRYTGVLSYGQRASINGKPIESPRGTFTRIVEPGDRVTMGSVSQVIREP